MSRSGVSQAQAMDHDDATDPPPQRADYYCWVEPDRGIRIFINFETAERLQVQVLCGLDSNGGAEVGGILLGRTDLHEGRITAVIEDFEPVPCTYSNGPLYSATGANAARFEAALERYKSATASGLSIVGYYRSHKRDDLCLSAGDLTLIQRVFPSIDNVFLLIKPLSRRACTGGFFFWDHGNIQSEFTLEVPFAPVRPPSPTPSDADAIDDLLLPDRLDLPQDRAPIPPGISREPLQDRRRARKLAVPALWIALSLGAFAYWQVRRSSATNHAPAAQKVKGSVQSAPIPAPIPSPSKQPLLVAQDGVFRAQAPRQQMIQRVSPPAISVTPAAAVAEPTLEEAPSLPGGATAVTPPPALQNVTPPAIEPPQAEPVIPAPSSAAVTNAESGPSQLPSRTVTVQPLCYLEQSEGAGSRGR